MIPTGYEVEATDDFAFPFQSRNRETYDSNEDNDWCGEWKPKLFQSRNRETYDSNLILFCALSTKPCYSFNLVIEKLMIPTTENRKARLTQTQRFNLVIEKLMIPTFCIIRKPMFF